MRLDIFLTNKFEGIHTRSQINNAIKDGNVTVNGIVTKKSGHDVNCSDIIDAQIEKDIITAEPENIEIEIIYEDDYLMIINKPRGMVVHPGAGNKRRTLLNALLYIMKDKEIERGGIVHRLDKNTAGLMVVAKTTATQNLLSKMFETHEVNRTYVGLVEGVLQGEGTITKNIIRDPNHRTLFKTTEKGGRTAITHYKVQKNYKKHTLLQFNLETGRTHQIRVHCKSIGHPLVGDPEYNPNSTIKKNWQMLESVEIKFKHPISPEKTVHFKKDLTDEFFGVISNIL